MPHFVRHTHHGRPAGWQHDVSHFINCDPELPISGFQAAPKAIREIARDTDAINGVSIGGETDPLSPMTFRKVGGLGLAAAEARMINPPGGEATA